MLQLQELRNELHALKQDVTDLLGKAGASIAIADVSSSQAEALAEQIKAVLSDLGEAVRSDEDRLGEIISDRPIATLASAFALGVVIGFALGRA